MDPLKRATRPASDYMGRGNNPGSVPVARGQKLAQQFYTQPGARVPNNTMVGNQIQQELGQMDNARINSNLYGDWRGQNLPSTGVNYALQPPAWGGARMMSQQPLVASEQLGDLRWAGQVNGAGGPLVAQPNEWVQTPGIAAESPRYPGTGQPMGLPLPSAPQGGVEDLINAQPLAAMPAGQELMYASRVEGHPAMAALPQAGNGASPNAGGMPALMPQTKEG